MNTTKVTKVTKVTTIKIKTSRFLFTEPIVAHLIQFATLHQYTPKKELKQNWIEFIITIKEDIENEKREFYEQGFKGTEEEIVTRMYNSCKYYYMKQLKQKQEKQQEKQQQDQTKKRKPYTRYSPEILYEIDEYIVYLIKEKEKEEKEKMIELTPNEAYQLYKDYKDYNKDKEDEKLKKTFKNRFQIISKKYK